MFILFVCIIWIASKYYLFLKNENELSDLFKNLEKKMSTKILYITDTSYVFYLLTELHNFAIDIDREDVHNKFAKKLHKLSGNLLLIIDFKNLKNQNMQNIIKALTSYSNLKNNMVITYVPYKAKESASLLALTGKTLIMGNYAVIDNTKIDQFLINLLEKYYGVSNARKISEKFYSETNSNGCYNCDDLETIKLKCFSEENISSHMPNIDKNDLLNLMSQIDKFFK